MASRRVRIKGIANIPQRRKVADSADAKLETDVKAPAVSAPKPPGEKQDTTAAPLTSPTVIINSVICPIKDETAKEEVVTTPQPSFNEEVATLPVSPALACHTTASPAKTASTPSGDEAVKEATVPVVPDEKANNTRGSSQEGPKPKAVPMRRKFIKPTISMAAISGRARRPEKPPIPEPEQPPAPEPASITEQINLNETILPPCSIPEPATANDQPTANLTVQGATKLPRPQFIEGTKPSSDTERPPPATSPSKLPNRSRIKAVPRLGQHRSSFSLGSASESEDESRKSHSSRIRNDSVSSVVSEYMHSESKESKAKEGGGGATTGAAQKKARRSQRARHLAEARREFLKKCGNGQPDRQRLTMMDLLFYNPTTNPMSRKETKSESAKVASEEVDDDLAEKDEASEEAAAAAEGNNDDQENEVPAPQIMIGANGEIIIDEKSLLIESSDVAKNREVLRNSTVIDGDNLDSPYATYKRGKKYKGWTKVETLRFYRAIHTIGTDFSMMVQLFPGRSRNDLKVKFKTEERRNRDLIDKAVYNPITFDLTEMLREVELEELQKKQNEKRKKEIEEFKQQKVETRSRRRKKSVAKDTEDEDEEEEAFVYKRPKMSASKYLKGGINSLFDSDDEDKSAEKPAAVDDDVFAEDANLLPGSIIHVTEENENGDTVDRIYSIGENGERILVEVDQDILDRLSQATFEEADAASNNNNDKTSDEQVVDINSAEIVLLDEMYCGAMNRQMLDTSA